MSIITRRTLIKSSAIPIAAAIGINRVERLAFASILETANFTMDLRCSSIGVRADQTEAIRLAHAHGFQSVTPNPGFLSTLSDDQTAKLLADMDDKKLVWGAAGLPVEFRRDEKTLADGIQRLPELARGLQRAGVTRVGTWLSPSHSELTYMANFRQHAKRLRACGQILSDHGIRFGLEYVGPKTLWASKRHSFVHSMAETKELIAEINLDNVGFVLDSWHWYTAHENTDDLRTLRNQDVVACDLNDAPAGIPIDEQIDNQRELPVATGVIDLRAFLTVLAEMGYDGPIRAEPFNQDLNRMDDESATAATAAAMRRALALVAS